MPLQATSGAASYDAFGGGAASVPTYIEDVFSTWLYTGTGATQTITNSIDTTTYGGLVWIKGRSGATGHRLTDTVRGVTKSLASNSTAAQATETTGLTAFGTTGFTIGADADYNTSAATYVGWTFRKQPKFFDIVTFVAGSSTNRTISHSLGSTPAFYVMKDVSGVSQWPAYHTSLGANQYVALNKTDATTTYSGAWGTGPTSTTFSVDETAFCTSGNTYVVYLFASNAGGFGLTGTDNVISCGSYTGSSTVDVTVTLGFEPQFVMIKNITTAATDWYIADIMRGMALTNIQPLLSPNLTDSETGFTGTYFTPTATGMKVQYGSGTAICSAGNTYIYVVIRRGPMKVPTSGTSVFNPIARAGTSATANISTGFVTDATIIKNRAGGFVGEIFDRLRGANTRLYPDQTSAESTTTDHLTSFATNDGYTLGASVSGEVNLSGYNYANWNFRRAPSYFDEVCYSGTGVAKTETHNLKAVPELMIVKSRAGTGRDWAVYTSATAATNFMYLNGTNASGASSTMWNDTSPTSSVFSVGTNLRTNNSGQTYVAYLFATCAGVSKVGSYTGNGSTQTINCGFTGGARFVLIKRTDSTGDWYVYDTARGMTTLTDPYLLLNSTAAESATLGSVTTVSTGFALNAGILAAINTNGASYIFLAIS